MRAFDLWKLLDLGVLIRDVVYILTGLECTHLRIYVYLYTLYMYTCTCLLSVYNLTHMSLYLSLFLSPLVFCVSLSLSIPLSVHVFVSRRGRESDAPAHANLLYIHAYLFMGTHACIEHMHMCTCVYRENPLPAETYWVYCTCWC